MSLTVIVNSRTVVHKGSSGKAPSVPDVCKTPAPPGPPVPIPYPNIAQSSDTSDGSKSVKMDCSMITLKNAKFSTSVGDEAGTLKGIVSSTNKGVAKFVNYSFNVKVEGKNVGRLGDPMTSNGNASNSMTPAEVQQVAVALGVSEEEAKIICEAFCECQQAYDRGDISGSGCCSKCFEEKIQERGTSAMRTEQSYYMPDVGNPEFLTPSVFNRLSSQLQGTRLYNFVKGLVSHGVSAPPGGSVSAGVGLRLSRALRRIPAGSSLQGVAGHVCRPDLTIVRDGATQVFDAKFEWKSGKDKLSDQQKRDYPRIDSEEDPKVIDNETCKCKRG